MSIQQCWDFLKTAESEHRSAGISIAEEILAQIARVKERTISFLNERSGGSM